MRVQSADSHAMGPRAKSSARMFSAPAIWPCSLMLTTGGFETAEHDSGLQVRHVLMGWHVWSLAR